MAYKLGINREPQRPLPADLQYAREILVSSYFIDDIARSASLLGPPRRQNGERTFRQLACFDRT